MRVNPPLLNYARRRRPEYGRSLFIFLEILGIALTIAFLALTIIVLASAFTGGPR